MSASAAAVAVAVEVAPTADNAVPGKIEALFGEYDTNGDGVISEVELTSSLEKAFPDMKPWAREHIPLQFQKYATGDPAGLDKPAFTKVYAAFLFRYFDDNGDGHLQVSECEAALKFLAGKDTAVACPPGDAAGIISKLDFWLMFKAMMGMPAPPARGQLEAAADALFAAGFTASDDEMSWLRARLDAMKMPTAN